MASAACLPDRQAFCYSKGMQKLLRKYILSYLTDAPDFGAWLRERFRHARTDRVSWLTAALGVMTVAVVVRLFSLQVLDFAFYAALASDQHQIQRILQASRGEILMRDHSQGDAEYPIATNKEFYQVYSVPKQVKDPEQAAEDLRVLVNTPAETLLAKLSNALDPYEPLERKVSPERYEAIKSLNIEGIYGVPETYRYYVDENIGSPIIGFVGLKDDLPHGFYGIEGYFNEILAGSPGYFETERDVAGRWIALSEKKIQEAADGADIVLTIDRTVQFMVCKKLNEAIVQYGAKGGAIVVLDPYSGQVMAMCSAPDFNPNYYNKIDDASVYNNKATYEAYEPGSIFKPVVMSAAIDLDRVEPNTTFVDPGFEEIDDFTIRNANDKVYGEQTMTGVLENSINTGMIHVARLMGREAFADYVKRFGFGEKTGVELNSEVAGNIVSVDKKGEIFMATASFGQGITVTPLQMAAAYSAIANGGNLYKPYIVDEVRHSDGRVEKRQPTLVRRVISSRASVLMVGMLTSVVTRGHAVKAQVPGYYVAGKTGTAQVADQKSGGYLEGVQNHSFVGFAPADEPRFVMSIKLDQPTSAVYADATTTPIFSELASFILNYYDVTPDY